MKDAREPLRLPIIHLSEGRQQPKFHHLLHCSNSLKTTSGRINEVQLTSIKFPSGRDLSLPARSGAWPPAARWFVRLLPAANVGVYLIFSPGEHFNLDNAFLIHTAMLLENSSFFNIVWEYKSNAPAGYRYNNYTAANFGIDSLSRVIFESISICLWPASGK